MLTTDQGGNGEEREWRREGRLRKKLCERRGERDTRDNEKNKHTQTIRARWREGERERDS